MRKILCLMIIIALILCGCAKKEAAVWDDFRLQEGKPDVYIYARDGRWGLADAKKKELTTPRFDEIMDFEGDYAMAYYTDYTAKAKDMSGVPEYPRYYGILNRKGETVVDFVYTSMIRQVGGGYYKVERDGLWGMMNTDGTMIFEPQVNKMEMDEVDPLYGQFIRVRKDITEGESKIVRYGLVNDLGEIVIPVEYDDLDVATDQGETIVTVTLKGEITQYRLENRRAILLEEDDIRARSHHISEQLCNNPLLYAYDINDLRGIITAAGTPVTEPVFSNISAFRGEYAVAAKFDYNGKPEDMSGVLEYPQRWGVIDMQGNTVVDFTYDSSISLSDDGSIIRYSEPTDWNDRVYGYKTIDGEIITEAKYLHADNFANGYALVGEFVPKPGTEQDMSGPSGEWYFGVIDTSGKEIIPLDYDEGEYHPDDGTVVLKRGGQTFYFHIKDGVAEPIVTVGDSFSLADYYPFTGKLVAKLDGEPTLAKRASGQYGHPRLDGATALFPVYSAVVEAVYPDETRYSAEDEHPLITCTKTNSAYERLVEGECDLIFVAEPSDAQIAYAASHGVEFVLTPFGREAFVFIVNQSNPLENISVEQIRKVYSGEMTNWNGLGIENLGEIVAYQRPKNSGSQTALEKLMGDVALMQAPSEYVEDFMGEVLDTIEYRNLPNAIGYTFRFFCTDMAKSGVKLLSVDGVAPTVENIRNESYPICSTLYMVSRKGEQNPNVQALIDWVLSEQGRELIEKSGYVAIG